MSFLIAFNGQLSPLGLNVERVTGGTPAVGSIHPSEGLPDFKEILHPLNDETSLKSHPLRTYHEHTRSYKKNKKRDHAKDIMSSPVRVISDNAFVAEAMELMKKFGFRHLPVVNGKNVIVGMISDRELLGSEGSRHCHEIMVQKVIVSDELTSINEIAITLLNEKINALPIVNKKNEVSGIITQSDILSYVIKTTSLLSTG